MNKREEILNKVSESVVLACLEVLEREHDSTSKLKVTVINDIECVAVACQVMREDVVPCLEFDWAPGLFRDIAQRVQEIQGSRKSYDFQVVLDED